MSTALAEIAGRTGAPLNGVDPTEFALGNNVLSLQTRRDRRAEFSSRTVVELENTRAHLELEIRPAIDRNQIVGNSAERHCFQIFVQLKLIEPFFRYLDIKSSQILVL